MKDHEPKRLAKKKRGKVLLIVILILLLLCAAAVGGYFGLCSWVRDNGMFLPGTTVSGLPDGEPADISGMTEAAAIALLEERVDANLATRDVTVSFCGKTARLSGGLLYTDAVAPVQRAVAAKAAIPLYELGAKWLGYYVTEEEQTVSALVITDEGVAAIEKLAEDIVRDVYIAPVGYTYTVGEESVEVTLGTEGRETDAEPIRQAVTEALLNGEASVTVETRPIPTTHITGEELYAAVLEPAQVSRRLEDGTISPTTFGRGILAEEAQALLDAAAPGDTVFVPFYELVPDLTLAEEGVLFQDMLCSSTTWMSGPEGRRTNIRLAAQAINGTVVLPGRTFSYNEIVGERTAEKGYQTATVYVQGEDRQELGGGICQLASAIYYCCLYSDLEIVERKPHRFAVTYVPYGLDATIAWGSIDYKFTNNTDHPIRVDAVTEGNNLIVHLYGTKTNDHYVEMERVQLSTTPYETVYEIDPTFVAGQSEEKVHAYTGYEYDTYRCVYDGKGNLISRTYEAYSRYRVRDKVILISAADATKYGIDPVTGQPLPEPEPVPEPSPAPSAEPSPAPSGEPSPAPTGEPSPEPTGEPSPEPTEEPASEPTDIPG